MKTIILSILGLFLVCCAYGQYWYEITASTNTPGSCESIDNHLLNGSFNGEVLDFDAAGDSYAEIIFSGGYSTSFSSLLSISGEFFCTNASGDNEGTDSYNSNINIPIPPDNCHQDFTIRTSPFEFGIFVRMKIWKIKPDVPAVDGYDPCIDPFIVLTSSDALDSYQWEASNGVDYLVVKTTNTPSVTISPSELANAGFTDPSGMFFFRLRNIGCDLNSVSNSTNGVQFRLPKPTATFEFRQPSCYGMDDGQVIVNSINGSGSYRITLKKQQPNSTYQDVGGQELVSDPISFPIILGSGLPITAGSYQIIVENNLDPSNNGGCYLTHNEFLGEPSLLSIIGNNVLQQVSCNNNDSGNNSDGKVQLVLENGTAPYTYFVNEGSGFTPINPDNVNILTPTFSGLDNGSYIFKATYLSPTGTICESLASGIVEVIEPEPLSLSSIKTDAKCKARNNGSINLNLSGGNGSYSYNWTATGDYSPYTIPNIEDPTNLFAGDYALTVTDSKGCSNAVPLNVSITEPASPVIVTATVPSRALHGGFDMTCALNDGIIELDIENEAFPINSYTWTKNGAPFSPSSFEYAENLTPGIYEVTILDNNNCDATTSVTLNPHPGITAITKATSDYNGFNTKCADTDEGEGLVETVTSAFGTISYTWFDGSSNQSISDLLPGNYAVTVSDGNGCSDDATLVITPPPAIQPNIQITSYHNGESISCPDALDGAMEAFPVNGFGTYTYLWDHGPNTKAVSGLSHGIYAVTVKDDYGCSVKSNLVISDPVTMQLNFTKTSYNGADLSCHNDADGEIQLTVANGIAPYTYTWSEGSSSQNISGLSAGDYTVNVTDQNNCVQTKNVTINNPPPLTLDLQHPIDRNGFDISCKGLADGSARAFVEGGTAPYSYLWSGGQTTETILGQSAGAYTVQVNDANNCPNSGSITLVEPPSLQVTTKVDNPVSCFGGTDGQISLTGMGGAGSYSYSLGGVTYQPLNIFDGLDMGTKNMFIMDGNGCSASVVETMTQPDVINIGFQNIEDAKCNDPVGSAQAVVIGGNGCYSYSWFEDATC